MTKAKTQQIETHACSEPMLTLPADFTALHIAYMCAKLYSDTQPSDLMPDFTIYEGGDFAMYNVHDKFDMAEHYFYTAFAIGESVKSNPNLPVQEAYDAAIAISADTVVREEVLDDVICAIEKYIKSGDQTTDEYIQEDYQILRDQEAEDKVDEIAKLEKQLADLKES